MSLPEFSDARIVDALIGLARATASQRVIVGGHDSADVSIALYRRNYRRVVTTKYCRFPCGQHDAAFVTWHDYGIKELEPVPGQMVDYLCPAGVLVVWIVPCEAIAERKLRQALEKLGLRIEAGTCCEGGVAIAARRRAVLPASRAA